MDYSNAQILDRSNAKAKLMLDANVFNYAESAFAATGVHLISYLNSLEGEIDWFVSSTVAVNLYNNGVVPGIMSNILNSNDPGMKMDHFPYIKTNGSLGFVKLNKLASDDWGQITLAYNHQDLIIVTNDSKMFKSAHVITEGRVIKFHEFIKKIGMNWPNDDNWQTLEEWFLQNVPPLRNNSSWLLPDDAHEQYRQKPSK